MNSRDEVLLILSPGFAASEADSTCLPAQQQLVLAINKNFPQLKVIILAFQYPFQSSSYEWFGNTVVAFGGRNRGRVHRVRLWVDVWNTLRKLKQEHAVKGILSFWYGECAFVGKRFSRLYGIKYFAWLLGQDAKPGNRYVPLTGAEAGDLVAISDFIAETFEDNYAVRPAHIITNAVTPGIFSKTGLIRDIDIIGVGSLITLKRYDLFIDIVAELKTSYPQISAVICGDGDQKEKLAALITGKGLEQNITLAGELPYPEVLEMMQRSKILLHPSSYEGFSGVCLEALYAGAHVISFTNPKRDWVRNWHIVEDYDEMLARVKTILQDEATEYRPVLPYDMNDVARQFIHLFDN